MAEFHHPDPDPRDVTSLVSLLEVLTELDALTDTRPEETIPPSELEEAHARAHAVLTQTAPPGDTPLAPIARLSVADEVEAWLAQAPLAAVRVRGPISMPTLDKYVPELEDYGYEPTVEIDADVDSTNHEAEITLVLRPVRDHPQPLQAVITSGDGTTRTAQVGPYGLAKLTAVPISETTPRDLTITFIPARKTTH
ncbi:hypothetical protein [Streptomyces sp. 142MFCol3.1]|uniref:hypothetical protein n=1 Tax=Streptomyces sp. 142MFCol3.1 TaxID=1172179 RepID=UPI00040F74FE|nr:hypothetical protein [Streptomyces sp. 142MFCol3.1]